MVRICEVCGKGEDECNITQSKKHNMTLCKKHYSQIEKHGKILNRTRFDPNEIHDCGSYYEMSLYDKDGVEVARTLIDKDDLGKVKDIKWHIDDNRYVVGYIRESRSQMLLHRAVMGNPKDMLIDHINRDTLDNRKENLRIATHHQNNLNMKKKKVRTSQYKGVYRDKDRGVFITTIYIEGKQRRFGSFSTELEAARAYDVNAIRHYGEYARLNFPMESYDDLSKYNHLMYENFKRNKYSKYHGVTKRGNSWIAYDSNKGKKTYIGSFKNEIDAARAYNNHILENELNKTLNDLSKETVINRNK